VVLAVIGARHTLGVAVSSVVLTGLFLGFGVRAWHRWEQRLDRRTRALVPDRIHCRPRRISSSERHVAFARALAVVAAAYQSECEQESSTP
jgi:hypothetical protein